MLSLVHHYDHASSILSNWSYILINLARNLYRASHPAMLYTLCSWNNFRLESFFAVKMFFLTLLLIIITYVHACTCITIHVLYNMYIILLLLLLHTYMYVHALQYMYIHNIIIIITYVHVCTCIILLHTCYDFYLRMPGSEYFLFHNSALTFHLIMCIPLARWTRYFREVGSG